MDDIMRLEEKHGLVRRELMVAVIYCKVGQVDPMSMLNNREPSAAFIDFLKLMGVLRSKGTMLDESGSSNRRRWNRRAVVWHVAIDMAEDQQRRYIGNDVAVMFFKDEGEPFDPSMVSALGSIPQVFVVVQPHKDKYRLGFFNKSSMLAFGPSLLKNTLFSAKSIVDYILVKLYNGLITSMLCPPMNKLYERPRAAAIAEVIFRWRPQLRLNGIKLF